MVDQTQVTGRAATNGGGDSPSRAVARNSAEFVHDVVTLVELQGSLLKLDLAQCLARLTVPAIVLAVGGVLVLSCVPILLAAVALLMVEVFEWSFAQGFFFALGCGLLVGGSAALYGVWHIRRSLALLERSKNEFHQNVNWIKQMLKRLGTLQRPVDRGPVERWDGH